MTVLQTAYDPQSAHAPEVKAGNVLAADYVLTHLGIKTTTNWSGSYADGNPIWGKAERHGDKSVSLVKQRQYGKNTVPDVHGMGARDAIFMMETRGVKTQIVGRGRVVKQSLAPGLRTKKGQVCVLTLDI